ncbi:hypothetical protein [Paraflavitalea speifideaquila]|uniref:hypothetical protein n=1 Tax=Paraflavitalea speifideaquila TaxID=3076558 RepID=UPI0028E1B2E1|nr:hypothetical protein [Paraflavitalea speifideiaquila]
MRKLKPLILSIAVVLVVGAALAAKRVNACPQPEYYKVGNNYFPAGIEGIDYDCEIGTGICTYYYDQSFGQYRPCKPGQYNALR